MASGGNRKRDRSRSPVNNVGRRRGAKSSINSHQSMDAKGDMMNPIMMNSMYQPGNMLMSGMYPNMMMAGGMMGNSMANMDMSAMATGMGTGMTGNMATGMTGGMGTVMAAGMTGGMTAGMATGMATGMTGNMGTGMDMGQQPMEMSPMAQTMTPAMGTTGSMDMSNMNMMGGMMMDPSMMAMGMYPNMAGDMIQVQEKKEIVLKTCKLTPPTQGTPDPPRRERPPGCRTIFVGGLPDKIKESIMREIFEMYGHINTLRLSKKNFCHIRFDREAAVDAAMRLSGYRIKLIEKEKEEEEEDTHGNSGWIHVDFALSRDDQNEFERRQRQMLRVQQAQMMTMASQNDGSMMGMDMSGGMDMAIESGRSARRSPSPVRVQPFSNAAIGQLSEKIKSEEQFYTSLPTLLSWLERGECSKKNSTQFYSMIQATNSHIRRLFNEKMQCEEELQECKERVKDKIEKVINQLEQVAKVFSAASHQRVWDHFTKPQRKNIETWQKMTQEFAALKDEFKEKFDNEDNDIGDFNNGNSYGMSNMPLAIGAPSHEELQQYKMENDSLKFQLEAYKNEVDVIKSDAKKEMEKFKAQFIARQALQGAMDNKNPPLPKPVEKPPPPPPLPEDLDSKVHIKEAVEAGCGEAKLIGVMAAFLQVHPQGASLDYVVSYVRALFPLVSQATVHHVLQKHEDVFQRATSGVGANIENRWSFVAFTRADA